MKQQKTLSELADVIRSKNAGPFMLTYDIMFSNKELFDLVWGSGEITKEKISRLLGVSIDQVVSIFPLVRGNAIKITIRRPRPQGSLGESDMYGCQQHAPLLDMIVSLS